MFLSVPTITDEIIYLTSGSWMVNAGEGRLELYTGSNFVTGSVLPIEGDICYNLIVRGDSSLSHVDGGCAFYFRPSNEVWYAPLTTDTWGWPAPFKDEIAGVWRISTSTGGVEAEWSYSETAAVPASAFGGPNLLSALPPVHLSTNGVARHPTQVLRGELTKPSGVIPGPASKTRHPTDQHGWFVVN